MTPAKVAHNRLKTVGYLFSRPGIVKIDVAPHGGEWEELVLRSEALAAFSTPAQAALLAPQQAEGWVMVPVEPTLGMIAAYLKANDAYWKRTDQLPTPPEKWRTGTPTQATAEGYRAMLAATPSAPTAVEPDERAEFEAWWEQFAAEHEEWRFADSHALRWQAWQARASKGTK